MIPFLSQAVAILASIFGISFIIVFHEFGHYLFCKIFKVYTPTFSIGIGKIIFSKKIGDTNFCISAGPIGGYVEVASEQGINGSYGFNQIPYYQKILIMLGGIFCNFLLAYISFVCLFVSGMPEGAISSYEPATTIVKSVASTSANSQELQPNDEIVSIDHQELHKNLTTARKLIAQHAQAAETTIPAQVLRNQEVVDINLHLAGKKTTPNLQKQLDVSFHTKPALTLPYALVESYHAVIFYVHSIIAGLKNMFHARTTQGFVGPLMAVAASSKSAQKGFGYLVFFLAVISINLGFMNLLPLPIFDGGQFVIFTIEAITRQQLSERIRNIIGMCSWALAIGLLVLFTIRDLQTLIFG